MTTSNRLDLWLRTVGSMKECVDMERISRCVIIDDLSPKEDVKKMLTHWPGLFPNIPLSVLENGHGGEFRHQHSMELWRAAVWNEEYVYHCEDDWEHHASPTRPIAWAISLLRQHDWIGQAAFPMMPRLLPFAEGTDFWIMTKENSTAHSPSRFTLQPNIMRIESIQRTGGFSRCKDFEIRYGERWLANGYLPVYHPQGFCTHLAIDPSASAYNLNHSLR